MASPALAVTVLTPTHNRASAITRAFESLLDQGDHLLEWRVVDDGSSDDCAVAIAACAARAFAVRYVRQDHGHKKTAFDLGVRLA